MPATRLQLCIAALVLTSPLANSGIDAPLNSHEGQGAALNAPAPVTIAAAPPAVEVTASIATHSPTVTATASTESVSQSVPTAAAGEPVSPGEPRTASR